MSLIEKLNELLALNNPEKAIDLLIDKTKETDKESYNSLILLKGRYKSNENDNNLGIVSRDEYRRTRAQIIVAFQHIMGNANFEDKVPEGAEKLAKIADLRKQYSALANINDLKFNAKSELDRINKMIASLTKK
ncbi:MAG: hypothetical protein U0W24_22245 [Bacteroidales bacterium]